METPKKLFIITIILAIAMILFFTVSVNSIFNEISDKKGEYEKHIGMKQIVGKDTLTIVDYSMLNETFTLSNGKKVSYKLISK